MADAKPALDRIGWIYIGIVMAWTTILATGMGFLWYYRRLPVLQMRRLPLVFAAMGLLHVYWSLCMVGYVVAPVAPCAAEYWIMSIIVPAGIAIFQIANTQFLYIASQQKRYTSVNSLEELVSGKKESALDGRNGSIWQRTWQRLRPMNQITRAVVYVSLGMVVQAILTIVIFLISRKFHPHFGLLEANLLGTKAEVRVRCSRGWEWWLSIAWQFFWAWIYAPYILWKSRGIQDTHGWRLQTILCCLTGLPCSPLWLCALYLPQFAKVNAVFIPPNWFSVSIFLIQSFTIFIPIHQMFRYQVLRTETLKAISDWEAKNKAFGSIDSDSTKVDTPTVLSLKTFVGSEKELRHVKSFDSSFPPRKTHLYQMLALENALKWNPKPLQQFAALKDFSGENVSFLTHLNSWRVSWITKDRYLKHKSSRLSYEGSHEPEHQLRERFNCALRLYVAFVSIEHAEFPINLSSKTLKTLDFIFADPVDILYGDSMSTISSTIAPFADESPIRNGDLESGQRPQPSISRESTLDPASVWYWGDIPEEFDINVFDEAEKEIKYLVLTNTWPKFVSAGYAEQILDEKGHNLTRRMSQLMFWR